MLATPCATAQRNGRHGSDGQGCAGRIDSNGGGLVSTDWRSFCEAQDMKTTVPLFSIVVAFLSVTISPLARATCQDACLTNYNTSLGEDALLNNTGSWN